MGIFSNIVFLYWVLVLIDSIFLYLYMGKVNIDMWLFENCMVIISCLKNWLIMYLFMLVDYVF